MSKTFKSFKAFGEYLLRKNPCPVCEIKPIRKGEVMCSECQLKQKEVYDTPGQ